MTELDDKKRRPKDNYFTKQKPRKITMDMTEDNPLQSNRYVLFLFQITI